MPFYEARHVRAPSAVSQAMKIVLIIAGCIVVAMLDLAFLRQASAIVA